MLETILTRQLLTACFAVALGWAFPWKPLGVQLQMDCISYDKILEIFFNKTSHNPVSTSNWLKTVWNFSTHFINYHHESISYIQGYLLGYIIGFVCGWPIADKLGRLNGLIYISLIRFLGTFILFLLSYETDNHTNLFLALGFTLGLYHGLLSIIGFLYIYEISPKYSTLQINLGALPVLAFYLLVKYSIQYFSSVINLCLHSVQNSYLTVLLSLAAGIGQIALFLKFCSETPSFTIIQRRQFKNSKRILQKLRQADNVSDEFKEIKWDRPQHESMKRTAYILMLYLFGVQYNYVFLQIGLILWIVHGVPLNIAQGIYFALIVISFTFATINYGRSTLTIPETKKLMFRSYTLFSILFILTCILFLLKFHSINHFIIDSTVVIISMIATFVFYSGPTVITTVLILDYPKQACRGNHFVLCVLFAFILVILIAILFSITLAFLFIVIGKLNIYIVTTYTATFLCFLVWLVWVKERKLDLKEEDGDNDSENITEEKEKVVSLSLLKLQDEI